ncbi:unnamed protein product [Rangifer tarandus platyrhynchus]|uniref:Uncharacterized protein n=1 Tax=Rangifer tarandus platyrhynchus TaxID=3082113 RepID=A0AC59Y9P0_RANTA
MRCAAVTAMQNKREDIRRKGREHTWWLAGLTGFTLSCGWVHDVPPHASWELWSPCSGPCYGPSSPSSHTIATPSAPHSQMMTLFLFEKMGAVSPSLTLPTDPPASHASLLPSFWDNEGTASVPFGSQSLGSP